MRGIVGRRMVAQGVVAVSLMLVSACGGAGAGAAEDTAAAATPSCMSSLRPVSVPKDASFPGDWPFPPGTVVTHVERVPGGGLALTAHVGSDFEKVLPFMQHDVERAGFVATQGEAEHDDAEATWTGGGYSGTWAIKSSDTCQGTTLLQVAAAKQ